MKKFLLTVLVGSLCVSTQSQIALEWSFVGQHVFNHNTVHFRQIGNTILAKAEMFEGGSHEQAQSMTTTGEENWYESYVNANQCTNCGLPGIKDIAISSIGDFYSVGEQPASPYTAGYFTKQDIDGNMVFVNEFFEGSIAREFHFVELSEDEQSVFIAGENVFTDDFNEIIYRMSTDGDIVESVSTSLSFPGAFDNNEGQLFIAEFQTNGIMIESYNEDLSYNWTYSNPLENMDYYYLKSTTLPNQAMLYTAIIEDFATSTLKLMFLEIDSNGNATLEYRDTPYNSSYFIQFNDVHRSPSGTIGLTYVARGNTMINEPQGIQGGKGGPVYNYLHCVTFDSSYNLIWDNFIPAYNGDQTNSFVLTKLFIDENETTIFAYTESFTNNEGAGSDINIVMLDNQGEIVDQYQAPDNFTFAAQGLFYAGNQTFYVQADALDENENNSWSMLKFSYLTSQVEAHPAPSFATYPNPFEDQLSLENNENSASCYIYDLEGRVVYQAHQLARGIHQLSLGNLSSGIYFLQLGTSLEPQKIVKH